MTDPLGPQGRRVIPVALAGRSYEVVIGRALLSEIGPRFAGLKPAAKAAVVADPTVARHYGPMVLDSLAVAGVKASLIEVPSGEGAKSFDGLEALCDALLAAKVERRDGVIALGGGVVGDLAGLAAGLIKRGVDFIQAPTTLLAQVDSSVGGKTAIDTRAGKNLVGLFHQPRLVLADLDTLTTLPPREVRAGLAEVVKYGLIGDAPFFAWCTREARALNTLSPSALSHAVGVSVAAKAAIVAADETEMGQRALLNLGHTFGHAIELLSGMDGSVLHGEAVAIGMGLAFDVSVALDLCPAPDAHAVRAGLAQLGLPLAVPEPVRRQGVDAFLAAMAQDKKNEAGRLTLILARGIGQAFVIKDAPVDKVAAHLQLSVFGTHPL
jgi:3-dehydroquinate synthase